MSDFVVFHMWEPFRQGSINMRLFYVAQAQKRFLSRFKNMDAESDQAVEEYLVCKEKNFDRD